MQHRLAFNSVAVALGAAIAVAVAASPPARAQSIIGRPDKAGVVVLLDHSCLPHTPAPLGTTIAGVFIPAMPGTMARFDCVGPNFREQTFTCLLTGVYDVVVAGAQGGKGPVEAINGPQQVFGGHDLDTEPGRGLGGLGGVVHGDIADLRRDQARVLAMKPACAQGSDGITSPRAVPCAAKIEFHRKAWNRERFLRRHNRPRPVLECTRWCH